MLRNAGPGGGVQRQIFRVVGTSIFNAAPPQLPIHQIPGNDFALDRSAKVVYTASEGLPGKWKVAAYNVLDGSRIGETLFDRGQAQAAIDIEISADGKYLYVLDDRLLVTRLRTDPLRKDLEIQVPPDWLTAPRTEDFGWRLKALRGTAESFVISSLGGRLIIYDGSQARPYTTSEFPSQLVENMEPLLATSQYIYARHRPREPGEDRNPCVTRYSIDSLGFTLPEDFCNLDSDWGRYPEMKRLGGSLVLQDGDEVVPVATESNGLRIDLPTNLGISPRLYRTPIGFEEDTYRFDVMELGNPSPIGRFPGIGELGIPSLARLVGDEALIYVEDKLDRRSVQLVPHWRSLTEWYSAPSSPVLRESRRYEGSIRGSTRSDTDQRR
jgi:hypothetical protein